MFIDQRRTTNYYHQLLQDVDRETLTTVMKRSDIDFLLETIDVLFVVIHFGFENIMQFSISRLKRVVENGQLS